MQNTTILFETTLEELKIDYKNTKPYVPKENGRVEKSRKKRSRKILL